MDDMTVARQALAMLKQNMAAAECHVAAINHYRTLAMDAINLLEKMCGAPQPLTADEMKLKEAVEPVLTAPVEENTGGLDVELDQHLVDAVCNAPDQTIVDQPVETDGHEPAQPDVVEEEPAAPPVEEKPKTRSKKKAKTKSEAKPEQVAENKPEPEPEPLPTPEPPAEPAQPAPEPEPVDSPQVDSQPADGPQTSRVVDMQTRVIELHYTQPEIEVMEQTFTNLVEFVKAHPGANEQSADPAAFEEFRATVTALPTEDELCSGVTEQLQRTMVNDLRYDVLLFLPSQRAETVAEWARTKHVKINGYDEFMADLQAKLAAEKAETKAKPEPELEPEPEPEPTPEPTQTVVVQPDDVEPAPADVKSATPLLTAEDTPPVSVMPKETGWDEVEREIAADRELATTTIMQAMSDGQPDVDDLKKDPTPTTSEGITTVDPQAERHAARKQETAPAPAPEPKPEPEPEPEPEPAPESKPASVHEPETKPTPTVDPTSKPMPWPEDDDPFAGYTQDGQAPADDKPFDPMAYEKINQVPAKFMDIYVEKALSIYDKLAADFPDDELSRRTIAYENALETARLMDGGNDLGTAILKVGPRIARQVILLKGGHGK